MTEMEKHALLGAMAFQQAAATPTTSVSGEDRSLACYDCVSYSIVHVSIFVFVWTVQIGGKQKVKDETPMDEYEKKMETLQKHIRDQACTA